MGAVQSVECERARAWVSLELDDELSEVEDALLRAHVGRCAACAAFARDVDGLTQEIRTTRLQRPVATRVSLHRRRAATRTLQLGAAAAAVAIAGGFGSLAGSLTSHPVPPPHSGAGRSIAL
ncbi:MAG TPA: zf-HC2 domain-containing protein [Gaiellaceae bacterium]|nr:zf-HC2 domain-containing protein [Gaiellaceae bacterium]HXY84798.1 zf-HC2 domain-containing protein [Gaiellaceae bacterium]